MNSKRITNWCICFILLLSSVAMSCKKDSSDKEIAQQQAAMKADSAIAKSSPGNYLAASGTLTLKIQDSVYTFDALQDSIAFVNMNVDNDQYFGITAINKAHTMSFGLSSKGMAGIDVSSTIEGSQLILRPDVMHNQQYSLTRFTEPGDAGKIQLLAYRQDTVLAKGSFFTFLAKDDKEGSPLYRVEGDFNLKIKK
jgi:hypothetical protein